MRQNGLENDRLARTLSVGARTASVLAIGFGCLGLSGWAWQLPALHHAPPNLPVMVPNTAVGFILAGLALERLRRNGSPTFSYYLAQVAAVVMALLGFVTLGEYALGWNAGLDHWLFRGTV